MLICAQRATCTPILTYVPGQVQKFQDQLERGKKMTPQRSIQQKRCMKLIKIKETALDLLLCFNRCQIVLLNKR